MNSKDPKIRLMQAKLRTYGKTKSLIAEYQKKDLQELKELKSKGIDWINRAMIELLNNNDPNFHKKFDDFVLRFEALEDAIQLK